MNRAALGYFAGSTVRGLNYTPSMLEHFNAASRA